MDFIQPWRAVGTDAAHLEAELRAELGSKHVLHGRRMKAIAVRQDCDDVLFVSTDEPLIVAVVHLTFANRPELDPRWPSTQLFESMPDWVERGMKVDHEEFVT